MHLNTVTIPLIICAICAFIAFAPDLASSSARTRVGEVFTDLDGDGIPEKVVKLQISNKNDTNVILEIFKEDKLVKSLVLPGAKDATFFFKKERSNMFAADVDGDGLNDVLTISRGADAESKLSVLSYKNGEFTTEL